jgi:hypothetical protein
MTNAEAGYWASRGVFDDLYGELDKLADWYKLLDDLGQLRFVTGESFSGAVHKLPGMEELYRWGTGPNTDMVVWCDGVSVVMAEVGSNDLVRWMSKREWDDWSNACPTMWVYVDPER